MGRGSSQRALLALTPLANTGVPSPTKRLPTKFITLGFTPTHTLRVTWNASGGVLLEILSPTLPPVTAATSLRSLHQWLLPLDVACKSDGTYAANVHGAFVLARVADKFLLKLNDNNSVNFVPVATASLTSVQTFLQQAKLEKLY